MSKENRDLIQLILDMQGIEDRLREFERKYRLRSNVFYQLVQEDKIEQRLELIEWVGLYEILQIREEEYRRLLQQQVEPMLASLNSAPLFA